MEFKHIIKSDSKGSCDHNLSFNLAKMGKFKYSILFNIALKKLYKDTSVSHDIELNNKNVILEGAAMRKRFPPPSTFSNPKKKKYLYSGVF